VSSIRPHDADTINWIEPPVNRWAFSHVRELTRTARIARGDHPSMTLPLDERPLDDVSFEHDGRQWTVGEMIAETYTDALVAIHDGVLVCDRYFDGMQPHDTHLLMSVSKSLTATLLGVLVGEGSIDIDATVPCYVPELAGPVWDGCTLQHLLDMRAGTFFDEGDYTDPNSLGRLTEEISGYVPRTRDDLAPDTRTLIRHLANVREHGGPFEYRSILTDVLAWVIESVTGERFHTLFGRHIWSRIGAECDADVIVDSTGFATVEGGICTTARDLARFGLMMLHAGSVDGQSVVPEGWVQRLRQHQPELVAAFESEADAGSINACYHDQWWVQDAAAGVYGGYGINGQRLAIDHPSNTVIVKFSTWPERHSDDLEAVTDAGFAAICGHLSARGR
jgi:hypothetical protein